MKGCKGWYIPLYLLSTLCTTLLLCIAYINQSNAFITQILLCWYIVMLIGVIIYQPYSLCMHNIGVFINMLVICSFLTWSCLKNIGIVASNEDEILYLFVVILLIAIQIIFTIARILYEIKKKWTKFYHYCLKNTNIT